MQNQRFVLFYSITIISSCGLSNSRQVLTIRNVMQIFICGWWLCPELYLQRPFSAHASSRLDTLMEAKAKQGVQVVSKE